MSSKKSAGQVAERRKEADTMEIIKGGVTAAKGFEAAAVAAADQISGTYGHGTDLQ